MFNLAYAKALFELERALRQAGVGLRLPAASILPGSPTPETVLQATYVDDQSYVLEASAPSELDRGIEVLLTAVIRVFGRHALKANFKKSKIRGLVGLLWPPCAPLPQAEGA